MTPSLKWSQKNKPAAKICYAISFPARGEALAAIASNLQIRSRIPRQYQHLYAQARSRQFTPRFRWAVDKQVAASPHVVLIRLRMQQVARLLADALVQVLSADDNAPLNLINIAGGPALDSINTLIFLRRALPGQLKRPVTIHVFDAEEDGPFFGANALMALKQPGAPLEGIDVKFEYHSYDWNKPAPIAALVSELRSRGEIVACVIRRRLVRIWKQ